MRIEKTQNTPQFGMAYYIKNVDINKNIYQYNIATKQMSRYIGSNKWRVCSRGYQQFQKEMGQLNLYDVAFNYETKSMEVIHKKTNKVVATFEKSPKYVLGSPKKFPGRKIWAYFFNPKEFLPQNVYLAGERAKELEKLALGIEK